MAAPAIAPPLASQWNTQNIYDTAAKFRSALDVNDSNASGLLLHAYGNAWKTLDGLAKAEVGKMAKAGLSSSYTQQRLAYIQAQIGAEVGKAAQFAGPYAKQQQADAIKAAGDHAQALVAAADPSIAGAFNRVPVEALTDLVGFTQAGSPLRQLFDQLGPDASKQARNALVSGLAAGFGPDKIARMMRESLAGNAARALTIVRTETHRAYREATRRNYQANSDIVKGWVWHSAMGVRTCACCWAMHGTFHDLDEHLDGHPNCRCAMLPVTKTYAELGFVEAEANPVKIDKGAGVFGKLDPATQRKILGPKAYDLFKAGEIALTDMVHRTDNGAWGTMRREATAAEALANASSDKSWYMKKPPEAAHVPFEAATALAHGDLVSALDAIAGQKAAQAAEKAAHALSVADLIDAHIASLEAAEAAQKAAEARAAEQSAFDAMTTTEKIAALDAKYNALITLSMTPGMGGLTGEQLGLKMEPIIVQLDALGKQLEVEQAAAKAAHEAQQQAAFDALPLTEKIAALTAQKDALYADAQAKTNAGMVGPAVDDLVAKHNEIVQQIKDLQKQLPTPADKVADAIHDLKAGLDQGNLSQAGFDLEIKAVLKQHPLTVQEIEHLTDTGKISPSEEDALKTALAANAPATAPAPKVAKPPGPKALANKTKKLADAVDAADAALQQAQADYDLTKSSPYATYSQKLAAKKVLDKAQKAADKADAALTQHTADHPEQNAVYAQHQQAKAQPAAPQHKTPAEIDKIQHDAYQFAVQQPGGFKWEHVETYLKSLPPIATADIHTALQAGAIFGDWANHMLKVAKEQQAAAHPASAAPSKTLPKDLAIAALDHAKNEYNSGAKTLAEYDKSVIDVLNISTLTLADLSDAYLNGQLQASPYIKAKTAIEDGTATPHPETGAATPPPAPVAPPIAPLPPHPVTTQQRTPPFTERDLKVDAAESARIGAIGAHSKTVLTDQNGQAWLFKPQPRHRAENDVATAEIARRSGLDAPDTYVFTYGGQLGSIQKMYATAANGGLRDAFPSGPFDPTKLDGKDTLQLQKHGVFDWLVGNHDSHTKQFVKFSGSGGKIHGVDKGQAFRFFGKDKLDYGYLPSTNPQDSVHNLMHRAYAQGKGLAHFQEVSLSAQNEITQYVRSLQAIPDAEYRAILRPYAENAARMGELAKGANFQNNVESFLDAAVARKHDLLKDFSAYHDRIKAERNAAMGVRGPVTAPPVVNGKQLKGMSGAHEFSSNSAGTTWGRKHWPGPDHFGVTTEEKGAVRTYTQSYYRNINDMLRGKGSYANPSAAERTRWEKVVGLIDKALAKAGMPEDVILHRGTGLDTWDVQPQQLVGTTQKDKGFMSTSVGTEPAFGGAILHLRVPKGYKAQYVDNGWTANTGEREIILSRDLEYFVYEVKQSAGKYGAPTWHVYAEVVPK